MTGPGPCSTPCDSPADEASALLAAWRQGDAAAGKTLVSRYNRVVIRFFRNKVYREADILPLVRRVFAVLRGERDRPDIPTSLYRIAYAVLRDYLGADERSGVDLTTFSAEALGTQTQPDVSRAQLPVVTALRRLPLEQHVALELTHWDRLTPHELASTLRMPLTEATRCLYDATARFKATLSADRDHEYTATRIY